MSVETQEVAQSVPDMAPMLHGLADQEVGGPVCYFVGGESGPVKIGYATNLKARLQNIQEGSPYKLRVLATAAGGIYREGAYHMQFAAHRLHGEWFERVPEIQDEIDRINGKLP
jgi:hypothetical protein